MQGLTALEQARWRAIVEVEAREEERLALESSLLDFFIAAWPRFDPKPLRVNFHHEIICEHLEAVAAGEIRYLMILVPPRSTKTSIVNICFPAWLWTRRWIAPLSGPQVRLLCLSYGFTLAHDIAVTARRLIMSEWYQARWGHRVTLNPDQQSIEHFSNTAGGARIAGYPGGTLGRGGGCRILDDLLSREQAESPVERAKVIQAYDEGLATRDTDPATTAEILIMQRFAEYDIAGHILDKYPGKFTIISLPMRFDERRCWVSTLRNPVIECDPRTEDGELLWPEQFPEPIVQEIEERLGPYAWAGQMQQIPGPRGGTIIKREWWKTWPDDAEGLAELRVAFSCPVCKWADYVETEYASINCPQCGSAARQIAPYPEFSYRLMSVDTAYGERDESSYSALTGWGVWHDRSGAPRAMMTDAWRGRPRLRGDPKATNPALQEGLVEVVYRIAQRRKADLVLIEQKTRGVDLYNELERAARNWPFQLAYSNPAGGTAIALPDGTAPSKRAKAMRLEACVPLFVNGLVWAPDLAWSETVIAEVTSFPQGEHFDLGDTVTQALRHLRDNGMLQTDAEYERETTEASAFRSRRWDVRDIYGL